MAVTSTTESTKLTLKIVVGQTESGADKYANRSVNNIYKDVTNANLYSFAGHVASLISGDVSKVLRTDVASLVDEG